MRVKKFPLNVNTKWELFINMYVFYFEKESTESKFSLSAIVNGFIKIGAPDIESIIEKYRYVMEHEYDIDRKLKAALAEFDKYKHYVE